MDQSQRGADPKMLDSTATDGSVDQAYGWGRAISLRWWWGIAALVALSACEDTPVQVDPTDFRDRLAALHGVDVTEITAGPGFQRAFRLEITQPLDHENPGGPSFTQRAYLSHVDETMPMVFAPGGYSVSEGSNQEITTILGSNQLTVAHRYFYGAEPYPLDWQYLTIEQAAADHHRIVELFKGIYSGTWLSSGVSKGGMTALYHKRFYPNDVGATLAYVSPFMFSVDDMRFVDSLAALGSQECRDDIHRFQRAALEHSDSLIWRFSALHAAEGLGHPADTVGAWEEMVRSYDWVFWQYYEEDCTGIPGPEATFDQMLAHLHDIVNIRRVSDGLSVMLRPFDYQAYTQVGTPGRRFDHIADLMTREPEPYSRGYFDSLGINLEYSPSTLLDVYEWLVTEGENIVFIYGGNDPLTAGAVELTGQTDALKVVQAGQNHGVRIADLDDQGRVLATLERWLGIPLPGAIASLAEVTGTGFDLVWYDMDR